MASSDTCPSCTSDDLLVVTLAPTGTPMAFHTCRHCEHRWWEQPAVAGDGGREIALGEVLATFSS